LHLQRRQEVREFVHREVDPLREVHEGEGIPRFRRPGADLGDGGVEVGKERGRDFVAFHRFRDAVEEPGLEGGGGVRHARLHATGRRAVDRGAAYRSGLCRYADEDARRTVACGPAGTHGKPRPSCRRLA
jgi:hypothetical protein